MHKLIDNRPLDDCKVPEEYCCLYGMRYVQIPFGNETRLLVPEPMYQAFIAGIGLDGQKESLLLPILVLPDRITIDEGGRLKLSNAEKKHFRRLTMGRGVSRTEKTPFYFITARKWEELDEKKLASSGSLVEFMAETGSAFLTEECDRGLRYQCANPEEKIHDSFCGLTWLLEDLRDLEMKMIAKRERIYLYYRALDLSNPIIYSLFGLLEAFHAVLEQEIIQIKKQGTDWL